MKNLIPLMILTLFAINLLAQHKCKDAVHPTENRKSILNCCIKEIKPGNVVVYALEDETYEIEAVAINYKGEYFDLRSNTEIVNVVKEDQYPGFLYEKHDYDYYNQLYKKANGQMVMGITIAGVGGGVLIGGIVHMQNYESESLFDWDDAGIGITLIGMAAIGIGIPIAIVGGSRKHKYKQVMLEIERNAKLSFRTTANGVGLVFNF